LLSEAEAHGEMSLACSKQGRTEGSKNEKASTISVWKMINIRMINLSVAKNTGRFVNDVNVVYFCIKIKYYDQTKYIVHETK